MNDSLKCERCDRDAVFHVAEQDGDTDTIHKHHFCEKHMDEYLGVDEGSTPQFGGRRETTMNDQATGNHRL